MSEQLVTARVAYGDAYVQPHILAAVKDVLPIKLVQLLDESLDYDSGKSVDIPQRFLQITQYESLPFPHALLSKPRATLINAYAIRKALIRKHYLSSTIEHHVVKNPASKLAKHFKQSVHFEIDYAEFLDEALYEAYELRDAFERNSGKDASEREWWILKPGMSDGGEGIRLFSTEEELQGIFEEWEDGLDDDDDDEDSVAAGDADGTGGNTNGESSAVVTSHLRHFIAQPYIDKPLLIPSEPYANRKFHIRTYVVAYGALKVYVFDQMLALFASTTFVPPWKTAGIHDSQNESGEDLNPEDLLQLMRSIHLTNTCVQRVGSKDLEARDNVYLLSSLPLADDAHQQVQKQIQETVSELFQAAVAQPTNFQPLPNAFEVYGLDFLVSGEEGGGNDVDVWLLEVNAFPDFAQTGSDLGERVVGGLWREIMREIVARHFDVEIKQASSDATGTLIRVLETDMHLH